MKAQTPESSLPQLQLLSVVMPARDEEGCIRGTIEHLHLELKIAGVPHEIVAVDDGSSDSTWPILLELKQSISELRPVQNNGDHGFGRALIYGINNSTGDALVIVMADASDDPRDVVMYWRELNAGYHAVFGSRFIKGGGIVDYPLFKRVMNRLANSFLQLMFHHGLNDTTNAFKAYRRIAIDGCRPFLAAHFNLTVELPLKTIIRGYSWSIVPITWRNRKTGESKLKIKEMGSRYLFIALYCWLEKSFSRGDYRR
jgi:dolichol-phosphate mannosyltransferase